MRMVHGFVCLLLAATSTAAPQGEELVITVGKEGELTKQELGVYETRGARELRKSSSELSADDK